MKVVFTPRCLEYESVGHPESPGRVRHIVDALKKDSAYEFVEPEPSTEDNLLLVHSQSHIDRVRKNDFSDADTPNIKDIYTYACLAVGSAIAASDIAVREGSAFSLARPPGHHAESDRVGGFCYFNNIAVAVAKLLKQGKKVAILDIDVHHGNGTQNIFFGIENVVYCSLHQVPLYPGTGLVSEKNCLNFPLPPGTDVTKYIEGLRQGLDHIQSFKPDVLAVSLGFDTYKNDPLAGFALEIDDYRDIGAALRVVNKPTFFILEGGYSKNIGHLAVAFFQGFLKNEKKV
jgi:acetoin utilization deacetylase AcuC-like enzyme